MLLPDLNGLCHDSKRAVELDGLSRDDDFSYFDWLNRLAKFRHGVLPDHVSFCGNFFFFENSELDGLCPRPSICRVQKCTYIT